MPQALTPNSRQVSVNKAIQDEGSDGSERISYSNGTSSDEEENFKDESSTTGILDEKQIRKNSIVKMETKVKNSASPLVHGHSGYSRAFVSTNIETSSSPLPT